MLMRLYLKVFSLNNNWHNVKGVAFNKKKLYYFDWIEKGFLFGYRLTWGRRIIYQEFFARWKIWFVVDLWLNTVRRRRCFIQGYVKTSSERRTSYRIRPILVLAGWRMASLSSSKRKRKEREKWFAMCTLFFLVSYLIISKVTKVYSQLDLLLQNMWLIFSFSNFATLTNYRSLIF